MSQSFHGHFVISCTANGQIVLTPKPGTRMTYYNSDAPDEQPAMVVVNPPHVILDYPDRPTITLKPPRDLIN